VRSNVPLLVVALLAGAVVGFVICVSPGWSFYGSSGVTLEPLAIGLGVLLALIGAPLVVLRRRAGLAVLAAAVGLLPGGLAGVAARPGPPEAVGGRVTITIDAPATVLVARATCTLDTVAGDSVGISDQAGSVDGRTLFVIGYLTRRSMELNLTQGAVADSSPFIDSNEYHWAVEVGGVSVGPDDVVLADMPMPTPVPIPDAPPMAVSGVTIAPRLLSGSFRFSGMQAVSADRPFSGGGWPLVLSGRVDWVCGP
jgi:hypothetical protein